jgi:hypothetical protein
MKYDLFFNVHIPRTGGTHFRENILNPLEQTFKENGINIYSKEKLDTAHWCWFKPFIQDSTYIYTSLRDPVSRLLSQFAWQAKDSIIKKTTNYKIEDINKFNFYKWLDDGYDIYKNFQAKNLVYYNKDHSIYTVATNTRWEDGGVPKRDHFLFDQDFINFNINKEDLVNNLKRINMVVDARDLKDNNKQFKIINKMLNDLNIPRLKYLDQSVHTVFSSHTTDKLMDSFTAAEIDKLYEYNDIDSEIYFSNYFTEY